MFSSHRRMQMAAIALVSSALNSSSLTFSGEAAVSVAETCAPIFPISVDAAVATTSALPAPYETVVPEKSMLCLAWISASASATGAVSFITGTDSPVRSAWSSRSVVDSRATSRESAGTRPPAATRMTSPGTSSEAAMTHNAPSRHTSASLGSYALSASMACSAFDSCHTPTTALSSKMRTMTSGSTRACRRSPASSPIARQNETAAAPTSILTSRSSNCARMRRSHGVGGSSGMAFGPCRTIRRSDSARSRPTARSTSRRLAASSAVSAHDALHAIPYE
mmetsp:Transcript_20495/g.67107  ORF Transcript_20495/g.67107 Transcript_20495/m.67107 type:complete len:280 (+) Transcript_20495:236-1075(+)